MVTTVSDDLTRVAPPPPPGPAAPRALRFALAGVVGLALLLTDNPARSRGNVLRPEVGGWWGEPLSWPTEAIHMHVLPNAKVLFSGHGDDSYLWDPAIGAISHVPPAGYKIFCSGHAYLPDGRLLFAGGEIGGNYWGAPHASLYDPATNAWTRLPDMNDGRWYPTNVTLANGQMLVIAGTKARSQNNTLPQVWTGTAWRDLTSAVDEIEMYPRMWLAPNGKVFMAGPQPISRYLDTRGAGAWTQVAPRLVHSRDYGAAVLYGEGKIFYAGGGNPPTPRVEVIDLNDPAPAWRKVGSLAIPRRQLNATLLPDGTILVTGGVSDGTFNDKSSPAFAAELWNPATERFTTLNGMARPRWYHSTALLLPDGRVLSAGGVDNANAEVFSPPYLFRGARPVIRSAPEQVDYGEAFHVETLAAGTVRHVTWLRLGSVTHSHNMEQRINRLPFAPTAGGLRVQAPADPNLSPPGPYMLFLLNEKGVPSVAKIVRIDRPRLDRRRG